MLRAVRASEIKSRTDFTAVSLLKATSAAKFVSKRKIYNIFPVDAAKTKSTRKKRINL